MTTKMRINLYCSEYNGGWIYQKFIDELKKYIEKSGNKWLINEKDPKKYDIIHFIPYYEYDEFLAKNKISSAWFSHKEIKNKTLRQKFDSVAQKVDLVFSHSKKYKDDIIELRSENVYQIIPGVDKEFKKPKKPNNNKKIIIGYVGRKYKSTTRKNETLLGLIDQEINKNQDKFEKIRYTNGKIIPEKMPEFYKNVDLIISPSAIEGGPMSLLESISCGTPFMCYDGVGMADEFDDNSGVIKIKKYNNDIVDPVAENGNFAESVEYFYDTETFITALLNFDKKKYNTNEMINNILSINKDKIRTWKSFSNDHIKYWKSKYDKQ